MLGRQVHTESHGDEAHHAREAHFRLRFMVHAVALSAYTILLVVVGVAWDELVCVDLLDVFHAKILRFDMGRRLHAVCVPQSAHVTCLPRSTGKASPEALWIAILTPVVGIVVLCACNQLLCHFLAEVVKSARVSQSQKPQCKNKAVGLSIIYPASDPGLVIKKSKSYRNAELPRDNTLACIRAYHLCGNTPRR
jgi:hypothetical protein